MSDDELDDWNDFLIEGDALYAYMINNFDSMFNDNTIKHFNIRDGHYWGIDDTEDIYNRDNIDIQYLLIPWIKKEFKENRLFNKTLWKPFRDQYTICDMYLGYRKLFKYKHYIFQLGIETICERYNCNFCDHSNDGKYLIPQKNTQHFVLALYGWKGDSDMLEPYKDIKLSLDDIMLEEHWIWK